MYKFNNTASLNVFKNGLQKLRMTKMGFFVD